MTKPSPLTRLMIHLSDIPDPRQPHRVLYGLGDVLFIAVCATIAGAQHWTDMEVFARERRDWLKKFIPIQEDTPSHDTFSRIFGLISPETFEECFLGWMQSIVEDKDSKFVAIDGKTLRRSYDKKRNKAAIHIVSAWASANGVVLGQLKTSGKSNEITAIPELLDRLDISNSVVTIDAMGCQKAIAEKIVDRKADYVLALKANHPKLYHEVTEFFGEAESISFSGVPHAFHETKNSGHGREEVRRYYVANADDWLMAHDSWKNLKSIVMLESRRKIGTQVSVERRFYITSLQYNSPLIPSAIREHWGIENKLHWVLDVVFNEDQCRIRDERAAENMSILRRIALNIIKSDSKSRSSVRARRIRAMWSAEYLETLLFSIPYVISTSGA